MNENINNLERIKENRKGENGTDSGYLARKSEMKVNTSKMQYLSTVAYNTHFDYFIRKAISELDPEIIKRAYELEEKHYQEVKRLAKLEAVNILAEENLV